MGSMKKEEVCHNTTKTIWSLTSQVLIDEMRCPEPKLLPLLPPAVSSL